MNGNQANGAANLQAATPVLLPLHTTRASYLWAQLYNQPDLYQVMTFPTTLVIGDLVVPIVLAVDEYFEHLRMDVERMVPLPAEYGVPNLRVFIAGGFIDRHLSADNVLAMLSYLKVRGAGIDYIGVERQVMGSAPQEEIHQNGIDDNEPPEQ
ncbi:MAG: hypothetical protein ASARMPRED_006878 [Alectoria sarmentosa]|nr:MAG: hypothetical protein ASARMPRED_006878 [Alectoria sarmentosa]